MFKDFSQNIHNVTENIVDSFYPRLFPNNFTFCVAVERKRVQNHTVWKFVLKTIQYEDEQKESIF